MNDLDRLLTGCDEPCLTSSQRLIDKKRIDKLLAMVRLLYSEAKCSLPECSHCKELHKQLNKIARGETHGKE
jgi:hypothetical protein